MADRQTNPGSCQNTHKNKYRMPNSARKKVQFELEFWDWDGAAAAADGCCCFTLPVGQKARAHEGVRLRLRQHPRRKSLADGLYSGELGDLKILLRLRWRTSSAAPPPPPPLCPKSYPPACYLSSPLFLTVAYSTNNIIFLKKTLIKIFKGTSTFKPQINFYLAF